MRPVLQSRTLAVSQWHNSQVANATLVLDRMRTTEVIEVADASTHVAAVDIRQHSGSEI